MNNNKNIKEFTDLRALQKAHILVLAIYSSTKKFPREEIFGLTSQMQRAAISVTSNIAEGFGRQTYKEKIQFYYLSQGSLTELKNQLIAAKDIGYLTNSRFQELIDVADDAHRLLQGLIAKSKAFLNRKS